MKKIFLLLFSSLSMVSIAQYVGPGPVMLHYRIYGKDAKPVGTKSKEYKVIINGTTGDKFYEDKKEWKEGEYFYRTRFNMRDYYPDPDTITINYGNEKMRIKTWNSLDSIPFSNGNYSIPKPYSDLLYLKTYNNVNILNGKNWDMFKVKNLWDIPDLKNLKADKVKLYIPKEKSYALSQLNYAADRKHLYILLTRYNEYSNQILYSKNNGINWGYLPVNLPKNENVIYVAAKNENEIYLISENKNLKRNNVFVVNESSITPRIDTTLSKLQLLYMSFVNEKVAYALGKSSTNKISIYKTVNGCKSWSVVYSGIEKEITSINFLNEQTGFMKSSNYAMLYMTPDGGQTWKIISSGDWNTSFSFYDQNVAYKYEPEKVKYDTSNYRLSRQGFLVSKTNDGGKNWIPVLSGLSSIFDVYFMQSPNKSVILSNDHLMVTKDGGKSWSYMGIEEPSVDGIMRYSSYATVGDSVLLFLSQNNLYRINVDK